MNPAAIEGLIQLGVKLFGSYKELQASFEGLKADNPEAYAEIERRHAATGAHLDRAARGEGRVGG